jgi:hypothetical protein
MFILQNYKLSFVSICQVLYEFFFDHKAHSLTQGVCKILDQFTSEFHIPKQGKESKNQYMYTNIYFPRYTRMCWRLSFRLLYMGTFKTPVNSALIENTLNRRDICTCPSHLHWARSYIISRVSACIDSDVHLEHFFCIVTWSTKRNRQLLNWERVF